MRVFIETQRFDQWWMRVILILVLATCALPFVFSNDPEMSDPAMIGILILAIGITILAVVLILFVMALKTKIDDQGVHVHFYPFKRSPRLIAWSEIENIYTRNYKPIGEYGGWGYRIKLGKTKNSAYNVKGTVGIQLELTSGKRVLIGTQKQSEADSVINYYRHKSQEL